MGEGKQAMKIGLGFDLHRLQKNRPLYLGGVRIDYPSGLLGHSDGDVILHAVADALLGSLARPDIGCLFPDTDPSLKGIRSTEILKKVMAMLRQERYGVHNLDVIIICEKPKLAPYYEEIRKSLAGLLKIPLSRVGLKAKTAEQLGFIGRGQAIACWAAVLVRPLLPQKSSFTSRR